MPQKCYLYPLNKFKIFQKNVYLCPSHNKRHILKHLPLSRGPSHGLPAHGNSSLPTPSPSFRQEYIRKTTTTTTDF